ncbi:hypothetical protein SCATT_23650 [Streptantibioticus cattleyicolor NRRL 8057 = DSM 46488]|uniref:Uncharacterized protein n=1 Tax=Streptantibioticus cattleyicolor (strain ATCC 35852 / DSM 46488 / JCM 4925 / NBRC 14057 / NRRL 8057) TaxID=1003195 RepID=G8WRX7_STREN|nr:hypothetical protein SCATT_23650 [Streptantibioticus cattleyicolor NRRL 8057 = DSM 46488]
MGRGVVCRPLGKPAGGRACGGPRTRDPCPRAGWDGRHANRGRSPPPRGGTSAQRPGMARRG